MNDDLLIQHLLDARLTPEEQRILNQRLREDAELRDHLREIAEQAVAIGDLARAEAARRGEFPQPEKVRPYGLMLLGLAASIALLLASAWIWLRARETPVLTLVDSSGSVSWSHGGDLRLGIRSGEKLPAGTLETVGEEANAQLRFADGTLIALSGETEMSFSEDTQKRLVLRRGSLTAYVRPQPKDRPLLVRTPSAEATVIGTVFNLSTRPEDTLLKVDEGLVKLRRLADGSEIDVPAKSSAVASLDSTSDLDPAATPEPVTDWSFDFATTVPPQIWRGVWENGRMVSSPFVAARNSDGTIVTHYGVSVRPPYLPSPLSLLVTEHTVLRYRLRQDKESSLQLMLLTGKRDGGFGGNFECKIGAKELRPDAEGWCELEVPISRFRVVDKREHVRKRHPSPVGRVINSALLTSYRQNSGLTVERFTLSSSAAP